MVVVGIGIAAGAAGAVAATRALASSLFEVSATDPSTFVAAALVLLAVALLAQAVPVARAMRVDPTIALRQE
jgi:putative ABC transport system permease protein